MGGLSAVLNLAKDAISASQSGLTVTGHNISNVSTSGYARQSVENQAKQPLKQAGLQVGMGVNVENILRSADTLLEGRLTAQKSDRASFEEQELYLNNLESIYNTDQENSLNGLLSQFWNTWHDLSNNPAGAAERKIIVEFGFQLADQFNNFSEELDRLDKNLLSEIDVGVSQVNSLAKEIAVVNSQVKAVEVASPANDQRDSRGQLITELAELIDVKVIEQPDNTVTLLTAGGYPLVIGQDAYQLRADKGTVEWVGTAGNKVDISTKISSGKMDGWMVMKDEVIKKLSTDLDSLAGELTWQVNKLHSQGVGKSYFSTEQTGTYVPLSGNLLSTLPFGNRIDYSKDFKMWIQDTQVPPNASSISVDMGKSTAAVSGFANAGTATADAQYRFTVTGAGTVTGFGDDPEIAWEKFDSDGNSLGSGSSVIAAPGNVTVGDLSFDMGEGTLVAGNTFTVNTDGLGDPHPLDLSANLAKPAHSVLDTYTFKVTEGSGNVTDVDLPPAGNPIEIEWSSRIDSGTLVLDDPRKLTFDVDGMSVSFNSGTLVKGEIFTLSTDAEGLPRSESGAFSVESPSSWQWTTDSFKDQFNRQSASVGSAVVADIDFDGHFQFKPTTGFFFAFSDTQSEDSGLMAALGINTFFTGRDANDFSVNPVMSDINNVAAAKVDGGALRAIVSDSDISLPVTISAGTNDTFQIEENGGVAPVTVTLTAGLYDTEAKLHSLAADLESKMNAASSLGSPGPYRATYDSEENRFLIRESDGSTLNNLNILWSGSSATAASLGFKPIDKRYLPPEGEIGVSDNTTSLAIADAKFTETGIPQWSFERGKGGFSTTVNTTVEGYFQETIGSLGVTSASIKRGMAFSDNLVEQLTQQRESISGVSLDEEMVKLIQFQQSYSAAAKLISTSDEMMQTLLAVK